MRLHYLSAKNAIFVVQWMKVSTHSSVASLLAALVHGINAAARDYLQYELRTNRRVVILMLRHRYAKLLVFCCCYGSYTCYQW